MKYHCELIQDLLPLYHDDVCSQESRRVVDEHLEECPCCKAVLDDLNGELLPKPEEAKPLVSIQVKWNKEKKKVFIRALVLTMLLSVILIAAIAAFSEWRFIPVDKDDLTLVDLYETSDGTIHFSYRNAYNGRGLSTLAVGEGGNWYLCDYRTIFGRKDYNVNVKRYFSFNPEVDQFEETKKNPFFGGVYFAADKVYLGVKDNPERSILVWERGMEVRAATSQEELDWSNYVAALTKNEE